MMGLRLLRRLWHLSPHALAQGVKRRIWPAGDLVGNLPPALHWHTVADGSLKGARLYLAIEGSEVWARMAEGTHDASLFQTLAGRRELSGAVCWDVGAHFGFHTFCFASLLGATGRVIAFEPNPANLARLRSHLDANPELASRIRVEPVAIADRTGVIRFVFHEDIDSGKSSTGYLIGSDPPLEHSTYDAFQSEEVEAVTVDELIYRRGLPPPDLMKIDVEGGEAAVLAGGGRFFSQSSPLLLIEVHHILQMKAVQERLLGWGYTVDVFEPEVASPGRCNILAQRANA